MTRRSPVVFVSDASAEAERIADALRSAGYVVADVPMSLLAARMGAQRPNIVLVDVDTDGVVDEIVKLRKLPGSGAIDFVYFGSGEGKIKNADDALLAEGSAFFMRPIDIGGLVRRVEALTGGPAVRPDVRPSTPPPFPSARPSGPVLPSPGVRTSGSPIPMSGPSLGDLVDPPRSLATFGTVSHELQQLLAEAELRAEVASSPDGPVPSPEEELESVLPADVLASLDEPIEGNEDEDADGLPRANPETSPGKDAHTKGTTSTGGTRPPTTGSRSSTGSQTHDRRVASEAPPRTVASVLPTTTSASMPPPPRVSLESEPPMGAIPRPSSWAPPPPARAPSVVLAGEASARRFFAEAVAKRATGALCFEHDGVIRRIILREGDLVTAASGGERESLVHFLGARGDLPRDEAERLAGKVPPHGRHAGAALVAHGWLRQDQLWPVLRAHAEWIASIVIVASGGRAELEPEAPGRLRSEPSVFGASTGAEIFVELVRRAVPPAEALERLGGESSRIADGPNASSGLIAECNLSPHDQELVTRSRGGSITDLLARAPDQEIVAVVHALALLGVLEIVTSPAFSRAPNRASDVEIQTLDEDAIRARVRARLELVEDGDYFAVLGVSRDATGYEVRRAFLELRRAFEPSRILTPRLVDLAPDVKQIVVVIEEAYEILRDNARRERYRRAIEARPG